MKETENKYTYLTPYEIKEIKKEDMDQILDRLNEKEKKYKRLFWEVQHYGKASILIYKNGRQIQTLHFDENNTANGFMFNELKSMAQNLEHMYQDYEILIETKIILSDTWDERDEPKTSKE